MKQCFSKLTKNSKKRGISLSKHWICAYKSHLSGTALKPRKKSHSERNATIHKNYIKLYTKLYFKQKNWVFTRESLMNTQYGAGDRIWRALPVIRSYLANTRLCSASPRAGSSPTVSKTKNIEIPQKWYLYIWCRWPDLTGSARHSLVPREHPIMFGFAEDRFKSYSFIKTK